MELLLEPGVALEDPVLVLGIAVPHVGARDLELVDDAIEAPCPEDPVARDDVPATPARSARPGAGGRGDRAPLPGGSGRARRRSGHRCADPGEGTPPAPNGGPSPQLGGPLRLTLWRGWSCRTRCALQIGRAHV